MNMRTICLTKLNSDNMTAKEILELQEEMKMLQWDLDTCRGQLLETTDEDEVNSLNEEIEIYQHDINLIIKKLNL